MSDYILELKNITKRFPGVLALDNVSFNLKAGEVHVVMGENGAGKSTLMKIINGIFAPDEGKITYNSQSVEITSPKKALDLGISMIHQELNPVLDMTVAENICLGKEPSKRGFLNKKEMNRSTEELLTSLNISIKPDHVMRDLSVAEMQMVEIAKAISYNSSIIIMDEPTSAISDREVDILFKMIKMLKEKDVAIIYISHKMKEIYRIADRITVLRDGGYVGTRHASEIDENELIALMVGRELNNMFPEKDNQCGDTIMRVRGLCLDGVFKDISFELKSGEILGFAGLMGAGRSEVVETIFGMRKATSGEVHINGTHRTFRKPLEAISHGMAMVTEDRKKTGLNLKTSVKKDMTIISLDDFCSVGPFINSKKEIKATDKQIDALKIKTPSRNQSICNLSGGNQQKVIIARWLMSQPEVLIMDEPTRGIDVGAKFEIYSIIIELAKKGKGIIMISSELPEILGICDRVVVMHEGQVSGVLEREEMSQEKIMALATNSKN